MKALVLEKDKVLTVQDRPIPAAPAPNSVLVRVAACGVCGSDIPRGFGGKAYFYPLVMGHEFSGVVEEGRPGGRFGKGDRVVIFPLIPTNRKERAYQTGDYAQMKEYNYFGSRCDGGFEEYLRVPEENLFLIPEHVKTLHAAMTEPAAVALHAVRKMHITAGDTAVVLGAGPIGNMTAQWLRIHGCREVYITDIDEKKLAIAEEMGFIPVNSAEVDPVEYIMELTEQQGAQRVVEAVGLPATFLQAVQLAARAGEVVFMGNIQGEFRIGEKDFSSLLRRELTIYGTWNSKIVPTGIDDWSTVLKYMDKELIVEPLISDVVGIERGPEIFQSIVDRKKFHNKVLIQLSDN